MASRKKQFWHFLLFLVSRSPLTNTARGQLFNLNHGLEVSDKTSTPRRRRHQNEVGACVDGNKCLGISPFSRQADETKYWEWFTIHIYNSVLACPPHSPSQTLAERFPAIGQASLTLAVRCARFQPTFTVCRAHPGKVTMGHYYFKRAYPLGITFSITRYRTAK